MVNWNLISGIEGKLSSQDIRRNILSYIIQNYPASLVKFIEKDHSTYRIDIMDGERLIFDFKGQFVTVCNYHIPLDER